MDIQQLILYSDDPLQVNNLTHCLHNSQSLRSSSASDFAQVHFLRGEKKLDSWKNWMRENVLMEELRQVSANGGEMDELERERVVVLEKKKALKKQKQDEFSKQRKLSMYASVTNLMPNLDDQSRILGYIVDRDTKAVQNFEIDTEKMAAYETCIGIWKKITP